MIRLRSRQIVLAVLLSGFVPSLAQDAAAQDAAADTAVPVSDAAFSPLSHTWEPPSDQPLDRERFIKFDRALQLIRQNKPENVPWADVLETLQSLLDLADGDSYLQLAVLNSKELTAAAGQQVKPLFSMKRTIESLLQALPPEGKRAYEQFYGTQARSLLKVAVESGTQTGLIEISQRYFHTIAGSEATLRLGMAALDRQRPFAALQDFERLRRESIHRLDWEPGLTLKTAMAWVAAGRKDQARRTVGELQSYLKRHPQLRQLLPEFARLPEVEFFAWMTQAMSARDRTGRGPRDWNHFLANPSRGGRTDRVNPVAVSLWESMTTGFDEQPTPELLNLYSPLQLERDQDFPIPDNRLQMAAAIQADLAFLNTEAEQLRHWPIPAMHPLVTQNRILFRTLNRVRCVDIATGRIEWETFTDDPAWADLFDIKAAGQLSIRLPRDPFWSPLNRFQHALIRQRTQVDRTSGTLTSDGQRVFFVTETGVPDRMTAIMAREGLRAVPLRWNTLCAANVSDGEVAWEIGGPRGERELPFAGSFFLGAPIHVDGLLYVLAEEDASVRLVCLDPATGEKYWWQTIARPIASVLHEAIRRVGGDAPTLAEGLLICPTSSGLITAYDPVMRRFVWTHRYESEVPPPRQSSRIAMGIPIAINMGLIGSADRWQESCILTAGGRIVVSPLDSDTLTCLDLLTGRLLWKQPRDAGLYVACVTSRHVVVVEPDRIHGLSVETGQTEWVTSLQGRGPTGRGVQDGENYHLPVLVRTGESSPHPRITSPYRGAILTIELSTGRILAGTTVAEGQRIGNLAAAHGVLVSQQAGSVLAFESFDDMEQRIAERLTDNPDDATALAMRGRMRLHHGHTGEGLDDLARSIQLQASSQVQRDYVEAVLAELKNGRMESEQAVTLLNDVPLGKKYQLVLDRIYAELLERSGQSGLAFEAYLSLARRVWGQPEQEWFSADGRTMSLTRWIGSRLADIHAQAAASKPETLEELEEQIVAALRQPAESETELPSADQSRLDALRFWLDLFAWHESVNDVRADYVSELDPGKNLLESEQLLAAAAGTSDGTAWPVYRQLLDLWISQSHEATAIAALPEFKTRFGTRAAAYADQLHRNEKVQAVKLQQFWPATEPSTASRPRKTAPVRRYSVPLVGDRSPAIEGWSFEYDRSRYMLVGRDSQGDQQWAVRLTGEGGRMQGVHPGTLSLFSTGHCLVAGVGSQFIVFDISGSAPVELWRENLSSGGHQPVFLMAQRGRLGVFRLTDGNRHAIGSLDLVTSQYVVYRKRSSLFVSRLLTGELVWKRTVVADTATVLGDDQHLILLREDSQAAEVLRLFDGDSVSMTSFSAGSGARLVASAGADPVLWIRKDAARFLVRFNSLTGMPVWSHEYTDRSLFRPVENTVVAIASPDGAFQMRDVMTGQAVVDTHSDPFDRLVAMHILPSMEGYLIFKAVAPRDPQVFPAPLRELGSQQHRIGGSAFAVSRETGKVLWSREMPNLLLSLDQPRNLPVFVLACERRRITQTRVDKEGFQFAVVDSRTGKMLLEQETPESSNAYRTSVSPAGFQIDIAFDKLIVTLDYPSE